MSWGQWTASLCTAEKLEVVLPVSGQSNSLNSRPTIRLPSFGSPVSMEVFPADSFFSYFSPFSSVCCFGFSNCQHIKGSLLNSHRHSPHSLFWQGFTVNLRFPQFLLPLQPSMEADHPMPKPVAHTHTQQTTKQRVSQFYKPSHPVKL